MNGRKISEIKVFERFKPCRSVYEVS